MRIALGTFACTGIRARLGSDLSTGVNSALSHYIQRLESGRTPIGIPSLCLAQAPQDPEIAIELKLDEETRAPLEREAKRQGATVDQLAAHAVLVYLADLDETPFRLLRGREAPGSRVRNVSGQNI
jgi:hypothetical protein